MHLLYGACVQANAASAMWRKWLAIVAECWRAAPDYFCVALSLVSAKVCSRSRLRSSYVPSLHDYFAGVRIRCNLHRNPRPSLYARSHLRRCGMCSRMRFGAAPAHQGGGEEDVVASGIFGMKSRTQFEQCANTPTHNQRTSRWLNNPGDDFEQGGLSRAIFTDDAPRFSPRNRQRDILNRAIVLVDGASGKQFKNGLQPA